MSRTSPRLSLTEFIDVVTRSGIPKATAIRTIKANDTYSPASDFYKLLREHIVEVHRKGQPKASLRSILPSLTDHKKIANYPVALEGYAKWWGSKTVSWFEPPRATVTRHGVDLSIAPEIGLAFGGVRHVIKLYLRGEALRQNRAEIILRLLESGLTARLKPGDVVAVLDVRRGRLLASSGKVPTVLLDALLDGELSYIATLWPSL